jgi:zinc transporter, ZIP family
LEQSLMFKAIGLGMVAQVSLVLCGLIVFWVTFRKRVVGAFAGLGAGLLIGAIAFDLVPDAQNLKSLEVAAWMLAGAAIFVISDKLIEAKFGSEGATAALGIVIGSIIDGVPESVIFGIQIAAGIPLSVAFLVAVIVSNVPQALAPSADLAAAGWSKMKLVGMWSAVVVACGAAAALGYGIASINTTAIGDRASAFAIGGVLAMLTDSLMPFSFERGGSMAGVWTVIGFCAALAMG